MVKMVCWKSTLLKKLAGVRFRHGKKGSLALDASEEVGGTCRHGDDDLLELDATEEAGGVCRHGEDGPSVLMMLKILAGVQTHSR